MLSEMSLCSAINALSIVDFIGRCGKHVRSLCTTWRCWEGQTCFWGCHLKHADVLRQGVEKHKNATSSPQVIFFACIYTLVVAGRHKVLLEKKKLGVGLGFEGRRYFGVEDLDPTEQMHVLQLTFSN